MSSSLIRIMHPPESELDGYSLILMAASRILKERVKNKTAQ